MPRPARLILIHGAWAGGWVWAPLTDALAGLGWQAEALELPGNGHHSIPAGDVTTADYLACLETAISGGPGPVALVGHSGGGMLVTAGAERFSDHVSHAVWVAGMLLPDGESFDDIQERIAGPGKRLGVTPHVVPSADGRTSSVPPKAAQRHFFQDLPPDVAAKAARRLTPQPTAGRHIAVQTGPAFAAVPKLYVLAADDRSVLPQVQRMMCDGVPNLTITEMPCGHAPQVADPQGLAARLDSWLSRTG